MVWTRRRTATKTQRRAFVLGAVSAICTGAVSSGARAADPVPSLDLRGFRVPTDPASGLYLEPAASPATLDYSVGLWLSYSYRPVTLVDDSAGDTQFKVIAHQITSDLTGVIGFAERVALGFDLPVLAWQTGDDPTPASRAVLGDTAVPRNALGDLGLVGKLTLVKPTGGDFGGFALALHDRFTLPTGDEASFLGEGHVTNEARVLAEYRLVALGVHAALGVKLRAEHESFACQGVPEDDCETRFGHELPFGLGFAFRPQAIGLDDAGRMTWFAEMHGYVPVSPRGPFSDSRLAEVQVGAAARYAFKEVSFLAGVEVPLLSGIGNPAFRGTLSVAWAPRLYDADKDGVEDETDQCPELAEDRDMFQDEDGCPEGDNDDDGVPDGEDRCPTEKEDEDGVSDEDGCDDPDNDNDKVPDVSDPCPNDPGPPSQNPKTTGCPVKDMDGDGIEAEKDKCPDAAEDKDGFEDEDGCPDPDNDGDGISDKDDVCPNLRGADSPNPKERGCPDPDRDKDTYNDAEDKCPDAAEVFNGVEDLDGCPEDEKRKGKPLVVIRETKDGPVAEMAAAVKFTATQEVDPQTLPLVRALAVELRKHPEWTVAVGVRPAAKAGPDGPVNESLTRSFAVVDLLRRFSRRDAVAETVAWVAVRSLPGAEAHGIGFLILTTAQPDAAKPDAKKAGETKPGDKKPETTDKKPADKPADKKPADKAPEKKPGDKPPEKKPDEKKPGDKPPETKPPPSAAPPQPTFKLPGPKPP